MTSENNTEHKIDDIKEKPISRWEKFGIFTQGIVAILILITILLTNQTLNEAKKSNEMLKNTFVRSYMPWIDVGTEYHFYKTIQDGEDKFAIDFNIENKSNVPASIIDANFELIPVSEVDIVKTGKKTSGFSSTIIFPNDSIEFNVVKEFSVEYNRLINLIRNKKLHLKFNITFQDILEHNKYFAEKQVKYKSEDIDKANMRIKFKNTIVYYKLEQIVD